MNWFYSFVTAFCATGICFGALYIICPGGKMEKSVKYIFSLCFLLIIITLAGVSVAKADFNIDFSSAQPVNTKETDIAFAKYTFALALQKAEVEFSEITLLTDNSSEGGISITKVIIYSDCERQRILNALGQAAENFEVEVINE